MNNLDFVVTRAPHRVSFGGGGSDLPGFYREGYGHVLSTSINRYVYVSTSYHSASFKEKFRLHYSEIELCESIPEITNNIIRECLKYAIENWGAIDSLTISTTSDIPSQSGLGSSSAFCAALLLNLATRLGVELDRETLARATCEIEIVRMAKPIGKQDQYASVYGGFNFLTFHESGDVSVETMPSRYIQEIIKDRACLISSGIFRSADEVLSHQADPTAPQRKLISSMVERVLRLKTALLEVRDLEEYFALISEELNFQTGLKLSVSEKIAPPILREKMRQLEEFGFTAMKINGAGGGGFLMGLILEEFPLNFAEHLRDKTGMIVERIDLDFEGVTIIYPKETRLRN